MHAFASTRLCYAIRPPYKRGGKNFVGSRSKVPALISYFFEVYHYKDFPLEDEGTH